MDYQKYCKQCKHYEFNYEKGLLCGLTHYKPKDIKHCEDYIFDESRKIIPEKKRNASKYSSKYHLENLDVYLKKWAISLISVGVLSIILSDLFSRIWGVVLIVIGILNFKVKKRTILIVDAFVLLIAGIINLMGTMLLKDFSPWFILGIFQLVFGIRELFRYKSYGKTENDASNRNTVLARYSLPGLISLIIPIVIVLSNVIMLIVNSVIYPSESALTEGSVSASFFVFIIFGGFLLSIMGIILGIIGLAKEETKKIVSAIGLVLNLALFFLIVNYIF